MKPCGALNLACMSCHLIKGVLKIYLSFMFIFVSNSVNKNNICFFLENFRYAGEYVEENKIIHITTIQRLFLFIFLCIFSPSLLLDVHFTWVVSFFRYAFYTHTHPYTDN